MKVLDVQLFEHIDYLRNEKGIQIKDFVIDVCERRQYSRYHSGENKMSHKILLGFLNKLGLSLIEFYYSFYRSENSEFHKVNKLYTLLINRKLDEAKSMFIELDSYEFSGVQAKQFFEFCQIYHNHLTKKGYHDHILERLSHLINYPDCLKQQSFNFVEIATIRLISEIEYLKKELNALEFLYEYLQNESNLLIFADKRDILPSIYASCSRIYGMLGEFDKSGIIASKGIEYCIKNETSFLLHTLHYFHALHFLKTSKIEDAIQAASNAIFILQAKNDNFNKERYFKLLNNDFGFDFQQYLEKNNQFN